MSKSYVTMTLCPICREENGQIMMDTRLRDKFEMHTLSLDPCKDCIKKYLKDGVMLINPETAQLVVIKVEAFERIFDQKIPEKHIAYCDERVLAKFQEVV